jgi:hypothetical protein
VSRWERLFADLETQWHAAARREDLEELPEILRADWARNTLADRLRAHAGSTAMLQLQAAGHSWTGTITRMGEDWLAVEAAETGRGVLLRLAALECVRGLRVRAVPPEPGVLGRLSLGHALRAVAAQETRAGLCLSGGTRMPVRLAGIGRDHLDTEPDDGPGQVMTVPYTALVAVDSTLAAVR